MLSTLFDSPGMENTGYWDLAGDDMDDFWRLAEENEPDTLNFDLAPVTDLNRLLDWSVETSEHQDKDPLLNHDCMWAGKCDDGQAHPNRFVTPNLNITASETVQSTPPGCSLLLTNRTRKSSRPPRPDTPQSLDEEEPPQFRHYVDLAGAFASSSSVSSSSEPEEDSRRSTVAADHSYTLSKSSAKHARFETLGVQTPSDSEEEIDVVSLGDKSGCCAGQGCLGRSPIGLPTNPSVRDRHDLQRTVATAIGERGAARKRGAPVVSLPHAPRKRGRQPSRRGPRSPAKRARIHPESDSDAENVEKRSLHNDMERQRRIGLKNLFDELKHEVPSTRDKERAPKVVILREAAALCRRLAAEERERDALRRQQARLLARVKQLRVALAASRH